MATGGQSRNPTVLSEPCTMPSLSRQWLTLVGAFRLQSSHMPPPGLQRREVRRSLPGSVDTEAVRKPGQSSYWPMLALSGWFIHSTLRLSITNIRACMIHTMPTPKNEESDARHRGRKAS